VNRLLVVAQALSDASRVRALLALDAQELCACQLVELLRLAPSTVSRHMAMLQQAHLVESRKSSRWVHYRIRRKSAPAEAREALAWVRRAASRDPAVTADRRRLARILRAMPADACAAGSCRVVGAPASRSAGR